MPYPIILSIWERARCRPKMPRSRVALWTGVAWRTWWFHANTAAVAERRARTFVSLVRPPGTIRAWESVVLTTWAR